MRRQNVRSEAKKESARLVEQLKRKNQQSPSGKLVPEDAYARLQRLVEKKIVSYSS